MDQKLTGALQENLLTLLCFDEQAAPIIKNTVEVGLFTTDIYREIAYHAVEFHDLFGKPIGQHLPDVFEDIIYGEDKRKANLYKKLLRDLFDFRTAVNRDYVLTSLTKFIRQQRLAQSITEAAKQIRAGRVDRAESELIRGLKEDLKTFDPGSYFSRSVSKVISHLRSESQFIPIGIPALTQISFGPTPQELLTILAPTSRGKTWMLVHIGKFAALQRKNVLHISLEMSEEKVLTRYYQSFYSISRRLKNVSVPVFNTDDKGRFSSMEFRDVQRPTLKSPGLRDYIKQQMSMGGPRFKILVKRFPTGQLTTKGMVAFLDVLEQQHGFIPHVILLDYPDLMKIDTANLRIDTGRVFKDIRGVAVERNLAMVAVTQGNRTSEDARLVTLKHLAEDYSKAAISDMVLSYSQTSLEKKHGLARLFVAKNRDEEAGITVLLGQAYHIGQFCLSSALLTSEYWDEFDRLPSDERPEDRESGGERRSSSKKKSAKRRWEKKKKSKST